MRKLLFLSIAILLISFAIVLLSNVSCARAGEIFEGEFLSVIDVEPPCGGNVQAGKFEIINEGPFFVTMILYVEIFPDNWVKVEEKRATKIANVMFYKPQNEGIIDFDQAPWFYDAVVTYDIRPAVFYWISGTEFVRVIAPSQMSCAGLDCDLAAENMQVEGFPCNMPMQVISYKK